VPTEEPKKAKLKESKKKKAGTEDSESLEWPDRRMVTFEEIQS
jgi:hypothetical protein